MILSALGSPTVIPSNVIGSERENSSDLILIDYWQHVANEGRDDPGSATYELRRIVVFHMPLL
jgi:hypothetical protein